MPNSLNPRNRHKDPSQRQTESTPKILRIFHYAGSHKDSTLQCLVVNSKRETAWVCSLDPTFAARNRLRLLLPVRSESQILVRTPSPYPYPCTYFYHLIFGSQPQHTSEDLLTSIKRLTRDTYPWLGASKPLAKRTLYII